MAATDPQRALREHVLYLLGGGGAHVDFDHTVTGFPADLRGKRPRGAPHSAWELLEHMRIAQWDILEFARDASHVSPEWPAGYWPETPEPPNRLAWSKSVASFQADLKALENLVADAATDLLTPIPHGQGQTVLREALLAADHNSYHLGQLMLVRRLLT